MMILSRREWRAVLNTIFGQLNMHPFDDNYLSKMSPGFEKKPTPETIVLPQQALTIQAGGPVERALAPKHPAPELFDAIAALIKQHLSCDQHQLTVLTLWIAHTWVDRKSVV